MRDDRRIEDIRFADIITFLTVHRTHNVTAAARELSVTASQVSKAIGRLEEALRTPLLIRGAKGVVSSPEAMALVPRLEELVTNARELGRVGEAEGHLSIAAPSYLCATFVAAAITAQTASQIRCMEVPPAFIRAYSTENLFQLALTLGEQQLTNVWVSQCIGQVHSGLFASRSVAQKVGANPSEATIREVPFIIPLYNADGQFLPSDDRCPIPRETRKRGHEAATYAVALEMAAHSDMMVFGPITGALPYVASGKLVEIEVPGWNVTSDVYLHVNSNRVRMPAQKRLVEALKTELARGAR